MRFDRNLFLRGIKDGIPIFLGYISVSFAFGMMAVESGMSPLTALLISMSNMTSAGQVAGVELIMNGGTYLEILAATIVINLRYALMSLSLSQKLDEKMPKIARILLPFGNTDEIFAVAMQQNGSVKAVYLLGLITMPYIGWSLGTILGATMMSLLPAILRSALGLALYGMFIAIIIPVAKQKKAVALTVILAALLSIMFYYTPGLNRISGGWVIIICAGIAAAVAAVLHPVEEVKEEE